MRCIRSSCRLADSPRLLMSAAARHGRIREQKHSTLTIAAIISARIHPNNSLRTSGPSSDRARARILVASIILTCFIIITAAPISFLLPLLVRTKTSKRAYKLTWAEFFAIAVPAMKSAAAAVMMLEYCMIVILSILFLGW